MAPTPNTGLDLTTLSAVKQWLQSGIVSSQAKTVPSVGPFQIQTNAQNPLSVFYAAGGQFTQVGATPAVGQFTFSNGLFGFNSADGGASVLLSYIQATNDDQKIQDCITAFAVYALHFTGRGPIDGTIPTSSPFVAPVAYDEFYDGSGTLRQPIRNWPIISVASVNVDGAIIPASTSINVWGYVIDGDRAFISIRGGFSPSVATFQNYRYQGGRGGFDRQGPGFRAGMQNVEIQYTAGFSGVPQDLEMLARKVVALNYKRSAWIGQKSQAMAQGAGTVSYGDWEMDEQDFKVMRYYKRRIA